MIIQHDNKTHQTTVNLAESGKQVALDAARKTFAKACMTSPVSGPSEFRAVAAYPTKWPPMMRTRPMS